MRDTCALGTVLPGIRASSSNSSKSPCTKRTSLFRICNCNSTPERCALLLRRSPLLVSNYCDRTSCELVVEVQTNRRSARQTDANMTEPILSSSITLHTYDDGCQVILVFVQLIYACKMVVCAQCNISSQFAHAHTRTHAVRACNETQPQLV